MENPWAEQEREMPPAGSSTGAEEEEAAAAGFTVIGGRRGRRKTAEEKQWWEGPLRRNELSRTFFHSFRFIGKLIKSEADWDEDEFDEVSSDLVDLANKMPPVKFFFRVIAPIVSLSRLAEKIQKLIEGRKKKDGDSATTQQAT